MVKILFYKITLLSSMLLILVMGLSSISAQESQAEVTKAEIRKTNEGFRIFLNDELFYVKGVGAGESTDPAELVRHGANAARTWTTYNGKQILDLAHQYGLKVFMGIWLVPERHGANYNDENQVRAQYERVRKVVMELKDHPALFCWGLGNELNLNASNLEVWNAVNDISKMIHELDPNHLTTTSLAGFESELLEEIVKRAPDLDFISTQLYGPMDSFNEIISKSVYKGPVLVTEWGATGYWEVPKTDWGAPIENHSSKKADLYLSRYQNGILKQSKQVMGSFAFLWGQKQERTPTWFGMFLADGTETEAIDVMHYAWKGTWPENRTPRLEAFSLDGKQPIDNIRLKVGQEYTAQVKVTDPDNDALIYKWVIMEESKSNKSGGDKEETPPEIKGLFNDDSGDTATFSAPAVSGAYRLFIYVYDGNNHAAHANIPFFVE